MVIIPFTPIHIKSTDLGFYLAAPLDVLLVSGFFQFTFFNFLIFLTRGAGKLAGGATK